MLTVHWSWILSHLYLPQMTHWLYNKWHMVPNGIAPNCSCRTTYLPSVDVDTNCEPTQCWGVDTNKSPPMPLPTIRGCGPCTVSTCRCGRVYLIWGWRVLNRTSSHVWDSWNLTVFLLRDGSLSLIYIAFLMVVAMLCNSLSTLVGWSMVLAWW